MAREPSTSDARVAAPAGAGVRHGLFLPPFDDLADPRLLARIAAEAEASGWAGLFLWDHVQYRAPVRAVLDPFVALAAIACSTSELRLGAMVTPLARRRPWVLARQMATLDLLSGGRMVLGVGLGLDQSGAELSSFGEELDARRRAAMLDEALGLVRALLAGEPVDHHGPDYRAENVRFLPASVQQPLPVWAAARWPHRAPLRRAARCEGVFAIDLAGPQDLASVGAFVSSERRAAGIDADGGFELVTTLPAGADPSGYAEAGATWLLSGPHAFEIDLGHLGRLVTGGPPG